MHGNSEFPPAHSFPCMGHPIAPPPCTQSQSGWPTRTGQPPCAQASVWRVHVGTVSERSEGEDEYVSHNMPVARRWQRAGKRAWWSRAAGLKTCCWRPCASPSLAWRHCSHGSRHFLFGEFAMGVLVVRVVRRQERERSKPRANLMMALPGPSLLTYVTGAAAEPESAWPNCSVSVCTYSPLASRT